MLIGRGPDFATTLTSSSGDIIDQYAETLCGGSDTKYRYNGAVPGDGALQRGHADGDPVSSGPPFMAPWWATPKVKGRKVAISLEALQLRQGRARPALLPAALDRLGA